MSDDQPHWRGAKRPEPFFIKSVVPIRHISREQRETALSEAKFNLFNLSSRDIYIDLLTDSGTGAMSQYQWAALMRGDESYAGSTSFERLKEAVGDLFGYDYVLPTHQGRSAELVIMAHFVKPGNYVPNNIHFDTTAAHVQYQKGTGVDLVVDEIYDWESEHPFKGNMDVAKLESFLADHAEQVPLVCHTLTCNSGGGQPVSLGNLKQVKQVCESYGKPLFLDAARIIENAYFIQQREEAYSNWSIPAILKETTEQAEGIWVSAKKDGLVNIGGFIGLRRQEHYEALRMYEILFDGFSSYGGMAGRDMEALVVGLYECCDEDYLLHRTGQVAHLTNLLREAGIRTTWPPGGHAVYIDGRHFCGHIPPTQFPAQAVSLALYLEAGVRSVEIGSILRGRHPQTGEDQHNGLDLVRLAIPRRTYSFTQLEYVASVLAGMKENAASIRGVRFVRETPVLRHFTSEFAWVEDQQPEST
ncbi:tryptophanase [bacterium]|nr:tryptophanase [bacterium]